MNEINEKQLLDSLWHEHLAFRYDGAKGSQGALIGLAGLSVILGKPALTAIPTELPSRGADPAVDLRQEVTIVDLGDIEHGSFPGAFERQQ